jgi:chloramphenicol-sensitive protein RarD
MPAERWFGFGLVWVALLILTIDMIVAMRRQRRAHGAASELERTGGIPTVDPLPE